MWILGQYKVFQFYVDYIWGDYERTKLSRREKEDKLSGGDVELGVISVAKEIGSQEREGK